MRAKLVGLTPVSCAWVTMSSVLGVPSSTIVLFHLARAAGKPRLPKPILPERRAGTPAAEAEAVAGREGEEAPAQLAPKAQSLCACAAAPLDPLMAANMVLAVVFLRDAFRATLVGVKGLAVVGAVSKNKP